MCVYVLSEVIAAHESVGGFYDVDDEVVVRVEIVFDDFVFEGS